MIDIGTKIPLTNGKYATVTKVLNKSTFVCFYRGKEGESNRMVTLDEILENRPIDLDLFHCDEYHTVDVVKEPKKAKK